MRPPLAARVLVLVSGFVLACNGSDVGPPATG
jgi:hypothetical protein